MKLKTTVSPFSFLEVIEDERLAKFNKAVKFDNKIRVSPAIYYLLKDHKELEQDFILRNLKVLDMDDKETLKANMKLLPADLFKKPPKLLD